MLELVIIACLSGEPSQCREEEMNIWHAYSKSACMRTAQFSLVRWRESHPNWRVRKFWCRPRSEKI